MGTVTDVRPEASVQETPTRPAERQVSGRDWIGFMAMVVGMFMAILDIQVVASSLSEIQAGISASQDEIAWVQTAYLVAEVVMIPLSGWLGRVLSTRWLFLASCITFTASSVACAFAWSIDAMIAFRALQGFLGGAMIPTVFATSFRLFPKERQAGVSVLVGLTATMAPTIGPTLGGWLTQTFSWHWLFLINVAPGLLVIACVFLFVHLDKPQPHLLRGFDWQGVLCIALGLGCLQYMLEEGPRDDWWEGDNIRNAAILSAIGFTLMLFRELTAEHPVVDLYAFRDRNFAVGCVFSFVIGIGLYGSVYVLPLYLGQVKGYDSMEIGITMMVTGLFQFISAPLAGTLAKKIDLRIVLGMGLALFGLGLYLNSQLTSAWGYWDLFLPQAVRGLSLMLCFVPVNQIALGMLPPEEVPNASGLYNLTRNLGGAIGMAALGTQINDRLKLHTLRLAEAVTSARDVVTQTLQQTADRLEPVYGVKAELAAKALMASRLQLQAMTLTYADALLMMASVFGLALFLMPLVRRVGVAGAGGGGH